MHDSRAFRSDPAAFDAALKPRVVPPLADLILSRDSERRERLTVLQEQQASRNALSKKVGEGRRAGADTSVIEQQVAELKGAMEGNEAAAAEHEAELKGILESLPNR